MLKKKKMLPQALNEGSVKILAKRNDPVFEPESFADDRPRVAACTVNHRCNIIAARAAISESDLAPQ